MNTTGVVVKGKSPILAVMWNVPELLYGIQALSGSFERKVSSAAESNEVNVKAV